MPDLVKMQQKGSLTIRAQFTGPKIRFNLIWTSQDLSYAASVSEIKYGNGIVN